VQNCSYCSREWPDEFKACPLCGRALINAVTSPAPSQSGGVNVESEQTTVHGDVTGGDKTVQGDEVGGDKVGGDKIGGNKEEIHGNKIEYHYHGSPQPSQAGAPLEASPSEYDLQAVRELMSAAFSDGDVVTLAFDRFRDVYEDISSGMGKSDKIRRLVDWCERHGHTETLLAEVKQRNPHQYARYAGRVKRKA
jgi:hypothetical protein